MRFMIAAIALLVAQPVAAQISAPTYRDTAGQIQGAQGVILLNTDGSNGSLPLRTTSTTTNGSVATANTFQSALAANSTRRGCAIYNNSTAAELIYLGAPGSATAANAIPLPAGGSFNCGGFQGIVLTDQVSITSATAGATFVVVSQ